MYTVGLFLRLLIYLLRVQCNIRNQALIVLVFLGVYFFIQILLELVALLMTFFFKRCHRWGAVDEALDMAVYIVPIPFIY